MASPRRPATLTMRMCGRFHPHCETIVALSSARTAPRANVAPLSLVITSKWRAPCVLFQYLYGGQMEQSLVRLGGLWLDHSLKPSMQVRGARSGQPRHCEDAALTTLDCGHVCFT